MLAALSSVGAAAGLAVDAHEVPGELVVGFKPTATEKQQRKAVDRAGATIEDTIESIDSAVVSVDPDEADAAAEELARQRGHRELFAISLAEPLFLAMGFQESTIMHYPEKIQRYLKISRSELSIGRKFCFSKLLAVDELRGQVA